MIGGICFQMLVTSHEVADSIHKKVVHVRKEGLEKILNFAGPNMGSSPNQFISSY
jgi:hypothetical protein